MEFRYARKTIRFNQTQGTKRLAPGYEKRRTPTDPVTLRGEERTLQFGAL